MRRASAASWTRYRTWRSRRSRMFRPGDIRRRASAGRPWRRSRETRDPQGGRTPKSPPPRRAPAQDPGRSLGQWPMMDQRAHETLRFAHRPAVARPIDRLRAAAQFVERGHVVAHRPVRRPDERGRPSHDVVRREKGLFFRQGEAQMIRRMAWRLDRGQPPIRSLDALALAKLLVGAVIAVGAAFEMVDFAQPQRPRLPMRTAADDRRAGRSLDGTRGRRVVPVGVRNQDVGCRFAPDRREQRCNVLRDVGTGIEDRHLPTPDDIAAGARERGRSRVAGHDPADERADRDAGVCSTWKAQIEGEFVAHR
jgi:hypothetical protein